MRGREIAWPSRLIEWLPRDYSPERDVILAMAYTACIAIKEGDSFEFRLKIHPEHDRVPFLDPTDPLHSCYLNLKQNKDGVLADILSNCVPESLQPLFVASELVLSSEKQDGVQATTTSPKPPTDVYRLIDGYSDSE
ncbi:splicing arginine serine-rich protein protein, putative [Babesia ovis]|uniref:Splicing arginine serine-rich protein protein, putative n=1 Tax=Babesia ovis TaxID=5869 RepID=A0A9W5WTC2_BABOV|nr:splicing arginine serine-rich protein protein, putative [Babesia ovis]